MVTESLTTTPEGLVGGRSGSGESFPTSDKAAELTTATELAPTLAPEAPPVNASLEVTLQLHIPPETIAMPREVAEVEIVWPSKDTIVATIDDLASDLDRLRRRKLATAAAVFVADEVEAALQSTMVMRFVRVAPPIESAPLPILTPEQREQDRFCRVVITLRALMKAGHIVGAMEEGNARAFINIVSGPKLDAEHLATFIKDRGGSLTMYSVLAQQILDSSRLRRAPTGPAVTSRDGYLVDKSGDISVAVESPPNIHPKSPANDLGWQEAALCAQVDPESFFPEKGASTKEAKRVCSMCEVRPECLVYTEANHERIGVAGGMSGRERRKLRRQRTTA